MAAEEFRNNKLRTFLSLLGVTFGIFCIISVLSTISSLEQAIQGDLKALGTNTVYIDKWEWKGSEDNPWWKYVNRPSPRFSEINILKQKVLAAQNIAFEIQTNDAIEYENSLINNVTYYGVSKEFFNIQNIEIPLGRTLQDADFEQATSSLLMGYTIAVELFGKAENALYKKVKLKGGRTGTIVGIVKKQGKNIVEMWNFDNSIIIGNKTLAQMTQEKWASPKIIVQGKTGLPTALLVDELTGAMRSLRKLKPAEENNFSLNDIDSFSKLVTEISSNVNKGGWAIAVLSLVVGMFGVANIMFVTVRERTSQIGLKKALGAKRSTILAEFLLESAFLCILGGLIGLLLVYILAKVFTALSGFPLFISPDMMFLAIGICIIVGVLAGIIPASIAAKMDPVVAIRSK